MKKTATTIVTSFTSVWNALKKNPTAFIGVTVRVTIGPSDRDAWIEATGIDPNTMTIDGNRPENTTNARDLARNCPTLADYDPDLGRVVICGVDTSRTCAGDGGHRSRFILRRIDLGESGTVDVLFSDRSASMGGFDQTGKKRDSTDELRVMQSEEYRDWSQWQSTTGQLVRLRAKNKSVKGGGKAGETWNGAILTPHQSASQWSDGTLAPVWTIAFEQHGESMKSLLQIFEAWKIASPTSKAWGNDQYRILGIIAVAIFDILGSDDETELGKLIDALDQQASKVAKTWEAFRTITQPKADIEQDYPAWLALIDAVYNDKNLPTLKQNLPVKVDGISKYYESTKAESEPVTE